MKGVELATIDTAVDREGTVWIFDTGVDGWRYYTDSGLSWDSHYQPPADYEPYIRLDSASSNRVRRTT